MFMVIFDFAGFAVRCRLLLSTDTVGIYGTYVLLPIEMTLAKCMQSHRYSCDPISDHSP